MPSELLASPLAKRPYDLRHAAVSWWLSSGVDPQTVAKRAGHSVSVLFRVYAKFINDSDDAANAKISARLGAGADGRPGSTKSVPRMSHTRWSAGEHR